MSKSIRRCVDCHEELFPFGFSHLGISFYSHKSYCPVKHYGLRAEYNTYINTEDEDLPLET